MSEARVQENLAQLKGLVTVEIIAHRLATLNQCDRLLMLEEGTVRALDTPAAVMGPNDFYRNAVGVQLVATQDGSPSSLSGVRLVKAAGCWVAAMGDN